MAKVGRFVTDPKAGAYCQITLDSGEKIIVNHDKKFMGFSSDRVFLCNLDSDEGRTALTQLTRNVRPDSVEATPLAAFVEYFKDCRSVSEIKAKCDALGASRGR